jgi:hypothetical protein
MKNGHKILGVAAEAKEDARVQKFLKDEVVNLINELKLRS